jgi:hypothetical protein
MPLTAHHVASNPMLDVVPAALTEIFKSCFWLSKARFAELRQQVQATAGLANDWDGYEAESPNDLARKITAKVLDFLEATLLPPVLLRASVEGGISVSFVEGCNRAEIEIYNTGEIVAATWSGQGEPCIRELDPTDSVLKNAIAEIRVRLAA